MSPLAPHARPPPFSTSPVRVRHLPKPADPHRHIVITQSPQFIVGFTLGVVYSVDLDNSIRTCIHHYRNIQSILLR